MLMCVVTDGTAAHKRNGSQYEDSIHVSCTQRLLSLPRIYMVGQSGAPSNPRSQFILTGGVSSILATAVTHMQSYTYIFGSMF